MLVPAEGRFLQHTKIGGREDPELAAADIAAWLAEILAPNRLTLVGPGTTTATFMAELGLPNTLLGVDAVHDGKVLASDCDEARLLSLLDAHDGAATILLTPTGGQGYLLGRGNQQFSPAVIRAVGRDGLCIIATKSKITALENRPLLVDTNDPQLDESLCGYHRVITGYEDQILYRVATAA